MERLGQPLIWGGDNQQWNMEIRDLRTVLRGPDWIWGIKNKAGYDDAASESGSGAALENPGWGTDTITIGVPDRKVVQKGPVGEGKGLGD